MSSLLRLAMHGLEGQVKLSDESEDLVRRFAGNAQSLAQGSVSSTFCSYMQQLSVAGNMLQRRCSA